MFFKNKNVTQSYLTKLIAVAFYTACFFMFIFYYIDASIILEYTPFVKFIGNYIWDSSGEFSTSSPVKILMTSFLTLSWLFVQTSQ